MRKRSYIFVVFLAATVFSIPAACETNADRALAIAIDRFHALGKGIQGRIDERGKETKYYVQLCPSRLEKYEKLVQRLNGTKVYFFNLSEACPGIEVTDSDGFNYVAVDPEMGNVYFLYPDSNALSAWKQFLISHPLHVWNEPDAEEVVDASLDLIGEHYDVATSDADVATTAHRAFDGAVTDACDRHELMKLFNKWWKGYELLGPMNLRRQCTPQMNGYKIELTFVKPPDFIRVGDYFDVPRVERQAFFIADGKFAVEKSVIYPSIHRWHPPPIECKPLK